MVDLRAADEMDLNAVNHFITLCGFVSRKTKKRRKNQA
jgi:hypothetical protein